MSFVAPVLIGPKRPRGRQPSSPGPANSTSPNFPTASKKTKSRPREDGAEVTSALGCGGRLFGFDDGLFSFDVSLAAFFMLFFVILFSHNWLYFVRGLRFGVRTMNFCSRRFNLYLLLMPMLWAVAGCADFHPFHHDKGPVAIVRIHVESESSSAGSTKSISVMRSDPVSVNISTDPILTESDITAARVVNSPGGGFAIELKLEETSGWKLETYTAINPGKHLAIFGQWSDKVQDGRWLAAPIIARRMAGNTLTFSPDASRQEAQTLVDGLNALAKKTAGVKSE
jgi:hypothetical protein